MQFAKKVGMFFVGCLLLVVIALHIAMPLFGQALFGFVAGSLGIWGLAHAFPLVAPYESGALVLLVICGKVYLAFALYILFIVTTGTYQHCCVGLNSFANHMRHARERHWENLVLAFGWPLALKRFDEWLTAWGMSWCDYAFGALKYWFYDRWRGILFESYDLKTGEVTREYLNSDGR